MAQIWRPILIRNNTINNDINKLNIVFHGFRIRDMTAKRSFTYCQLGVNRSELNRLPGADSLRIVVVNVVALSENPFSVHSYILLRWYEGDMKI